MLRIATLTALLAAATGCLPTAAILVASEIENANNPNEFDTGFGFVDTGLYGGDVANARGTMRGATPYGATDGQLANSTVERLADSVFLDLHTLDGGWTMIAGGIDASDINAGPIDGYAFAGCAGPGEWEMYFDGQPDTVQVDAIEIDGMVEYTVTATFGDDVVTAVAVVPQENPED